MGIDCSSKSVDFVLLDARGGFSKKGRIETDSEDFDNKLFDLENKFMVVFDDELEKYNIETAIIEGPIFYGNPKTSFGIAQIITMVKLILHNRNIDSFTVDNKSWKKSVLGNGAASKEEIAKFAKLKWNNKVETQDEFDAASIAFYGVQRFGKIKP